MKLTLILVTIVCVFYPNFLLNAPIKNKPITLETITFSDQLAGPRALALEERVILKWNLAEKKTKIDLILFQNGNPVGIIGSQIPVKNKTFTWTIGMYEKGITKTGTNYVVKVKSNPENFLDKVIGPFEIYQPWFLKLTSKLEGKKLPFGAAIPITWNSWGVSGNVIITLYHKDKELGVIASNIPVQKAFFNWNVGKYIGGEAENTAGYSLKISAMEDQYYDESQTTFQILQNHFLSVTSPNGKEEYRLKNKIPITWKKALIDGMVDILLLYNGSEIGSIANNIPLAKDYYIWDTGTNNPINTALKPGPGYQVKIVTKDKTYQDISNFDFRLIGPGDIKILSPSSYRKNLPLESTIQIKWKSTDLFDNLNIELIKNGHKIGDIAFGINAELGNYQWQVGELISNEYKYKQKDKYKIRLVTENGEVAAITENPLTFNDKPFITFIAQPDQQKLLTGSKIWLKWVSSGITEQVDIILTKNDKKVGTIAKERKPMKGKIQWQVGRFPGQSNELIGNYKIKFSIPPQTPVFQNQVKITIVPPLKISPVNSLPEPKTVKIAQNKIFITLAETIRKNLFQTNDMEGSEPDLKKNISTLFKEAAGLSETEEHQTYLNWFSDNYPKNNFQVPEASCPEVYFHQFTTTSQFQVFFYKSDHSLNNIYQALYNIIGEMQTNIPNLKAPEIAFNQVIPEIKITDLIASSHPDRLVLLSFNDQDSGAEKSPQFLVFRNLIRTHCQAVLEPLAQTLLSKNWQQAVNPQSYQIYLILHKLSHFLGPLPVYYDQKTEDLLPVTEKIKENFPKLEELKADMIALHNIPLLIQNKIIPEHHEPNIYLTYLMSAISRLRQDPNYQQNRLYSFPFKYFIKTGAVSVDSPGGKVTLYLDMLLFRKAIKFLIKQILNYYDPSNSIFKSEKTNSIEIYKLLDATRSIPLATSFKFSVN